MDRFELIQHALDANAFKSTDTSAGYINPTFWNSQVLKSTESLMVCVQGAKEYTDLLNNGGQTLNVTVGVEATAAGALVESTAATGSALTYTQVVFTPTEYGKMYQLTDKEARRSFFSLMQDVTQKLGYGLAREREAFAVALLTASAGNKVTANSVASSSIASSDVLDYPTIINGITEIEADKFTARDCILAVHPRQKGSLMKDKNFYQAYSYGGREVIYNGEIGMIAGLRVLISDEITATSSKAKAIILGKHRDGTQCFGIAYKQSPRIETQRWVAERKTDVVATEEWDMQILYANAVCTLETYCA